MEDILLVHLIAVLYHHIPFRVPRPPSAGFVGAFAEWAFKATKQLVKLCCRTGQQGPMLQRYRQLLAMITRGDVTRNRAEKAINGILDLVSATSEATLSAGGGSSSGGRAGHDSDMAVDADGSVGSSSSSGRPASDGGSLLQDFYNTTLTALEGAGGNEVRGSCRSLAAWVVTLHRSLSVTKSAKFPFLLLSHCPLQRLCFKTRLKLARLFLTQVDWSRLGPLLRQLQEAALGTSSSGMGAGGGGEAEKSAATQALEVYALMIQMYTEIRDMKRLSATYKVRGGCRYISGC